MQPTPTNRTEDLPSEDSENLFAEPAATGAQNESMFGGAPGPHASVPGSLAAAQAVRPRSLSRSIALWLLPLVALACLAVIAVIASHRQPANDGNTRGLGNAAAPQAPADNKRP